MSDEPRYRIIYRHRNSIFAAGVVAPEYSSCFTYPWPAMLTMVRRSCEDRAPLRAVRVERVAESCS